MTEFPHEKFTTDSRQAWRKLGFYVDLDPVKKYRLISGSYKGLLNFCQILDEFSKNPDYANHAASAHYGPYANLRLMTHDECGIDQTNIYGTRRDMSRLSGLIEDELSSAIPGDKILIREQYSPKSRYSLFITVREDSFDPASLDPEKWAKD